MACGLGLDSSFALAYAELGTAAYVGNNRPVGDAHFDRALSLLDRLTTREQLQIRAASEAWRGNRDQSIALRRTLLAEYPDDPAAWGQIGYEYMRLGRSADAIAALRRQIERDSTNAADYINLASALKGTSDYEESVRAYTRAFALRPAMFRISNMNHEYGSVLVLAGRLADARAVFDSMLRGNAGQRASGERSLAWLEMFQGHYDSAIAHFRQATLLMQIPDGQLSEGRNRLLFAAAAQAKGGAWRDSASAQIRSAFELFRTVYIAPPFLWYVGTALARDGQLARAQEVLDTLGKRAKPANPTDRANLLALTGEVALARQLADSAVRSLQRAMAIDSSALVTESLARALAHAGDLGGAIRLYESIAGKPARWFGWEPQPAGLLAFWNVGQLYEASGDTARAAAAYGRLLAQWPSVDSDLIAVQHARARLNELKSGRDNNSRRR
ncbi:MAG: tetratricopeptide repeat protein [Longimicrobiales bacterium]